jgi:thiosulfate reductase cytochrome b subunit
MMLSFTTLVVTGWPLKSASVGDTGELVHALGGPALLSTIHRGAGALLLLVSVYHVVWVLTGLRAGRVQLAMIPGLKDATDAVGNILYFLGVRKEKPRFGRFTYYEKFDYWAVFWGMAIMGTTGLALWFPVLVSRITGGSVIEVAKIAHSDEALLAALAIFVWHFYNVHLRPTIFPMSWVWLTGRISAEAMYEEHREEYAARFGDHPPQDHDRPTPWWSKAGWSIAGLWTVIIVSAAVVKADFDVLGRRIEELSSSPVLEAAAEARHPVTRGATRTTLVPAEQFAKCLSCHDQDDYATDGHFPHEDHLDDYFEGEVEATCADCHVMAWHRSVTTSKQICLKCHDAGSRELRF